MQEFSFVFDDSKSLEQLQNKRAINNIIFNPTILLLNSYFLYLKNSSF